MIILNMKEGFIIVVVCIILLCIGFFIIFFEYIIFFVLFLSFLFKESEWLCDIDLKDEILGSIDFFFFD